MSNIELGGAGKFSLHGSSSENEVLLETKPTVASMFSDFVKEHNHSLIFGPIFVVFVIVYAVLMSLSVTQTNSAKYVHFKNLKYQSV